MLSTIPVKIEIRTQDVDFFNAAQERFSSINGLEVRKQIFVCDAIDWDATSKRAVTAVVYASSVIALDFLGAWLAERFISTPPEQVIFNNQIINYEQVNITIHQHIQQDKACLEKK